MTLTGFDKSTVKAHQVGYHPAIGKFALVPQANSNILSVSELLKHGFKISFSGVICTIQSTIAYLDTQNYKIITNLNRRRALWFISSQQLEHLAINNTQILCPIAINQTAYDIKGPHHSMLSADQIDRANKAHKLHHQLLHPSDNQLIRALSAGLFNNTSVTPADVKLARELHGACPQCMAGKTRNKSYKESTTPPATFVGERVHVDLLPFKDNMGVYKTTGGSFDYILMIDEYSGHMSYIGIANKGTKTIQMAFDELINEYLAYGHQIKHITTDHEVTLSACKSYINSKGIIMSHVPPY